MTEDRKNPFPSNIITSTHTMELGIVLDSQVARL